MAIVASTIDIQILYFAGLADEAQCHEEKLSVAQGTSLADLYAQLAQKHRFTRPQSELRVAVNDYFAAWTDEVNAGDSVVFILPVAGG